MWIRQKGDRGGLPCNVEFDGSDCGIDSQHLDNIIFSDHSAGANLFFMQKVPRML